MHPEAASNVIRQKGKGKKGRKGKEIKNAGIFGVHCICMAISMVHRKQSVLSSLIPFVIANGPHNSSWKANLTPPSFKKKNKNKSRGVNGPFVDPFSNI